jgi:hypothetical protein
MKGFEFFLGVARQVLRTILYGWVLGAIELAKGLWAKICAKVAGKRLPHPDRNALEACASLLHPAFRRPDPCIYSQSYLTSLGLPVTWDNPDIALRLNGVVVPEHDLQPATEYELEATVWNNSYTAPALGTLVEFSFLSFGVGTVSHPIGSTVVNVGVKGGPGHPAKATVKWTTPATPGHYCVQAKLTAADDAEPQNNLGQNNVDVALAQSPAHFEFALRNRLPREARFRFTTDAYQIPEQPDCAVTPFRREPRSERIKRVIALNRERGFGVPAGWSVTIAPDGPTLGPGDETVIAVDIEPPPGFSGEKTFNVNAFAGAAFAGGVTLTVRAA